ARSGRERVPAEGRSGGRVGARDPRRGQRPALSRRGRGPSGRAAALSQDGPGRGRKGGGGAAEPSRARSAGPARPRAQLQGNRPEAVPESENRGRVPCPAEGSPRTHAPPRAGAVCPPNRVAGRALARRTRHSQSSVFTSASTD